MPQPGGVPRGLARTLVRVRDLALDLATGDLALVEGRASLTSGVGAVAQKLWIRLSLWRGEWFADLAVGIPYLAILGQKGVEAFAEATFRRAISTCPGVAALDDFSFALGGRRAASVSFRARTVDGEVLDVTDFVAEAA